MLVEGFIKMLEQYPRAFVKMVYMIVDKATYEADVRGVGFYSVGFDGTDSTSLLTLTCEGQHNMKARDIIEMLSNRYSSMQREILIQPTNDQTPFTIARVDFLDYWMRPYNRDEDEGGDRYHNGETFFLIAKQSFPPA